jgi:ABC-type branched-subunit amino acid transport system substrate-binding protein
VPGRGLAVVLALSLLAGACSDDDSDEGASGDDERQTETTEPGQIDTEAVLAAAREAGPADPSCEATSDGVLRLGSLLPTAGEVAVFGPAISGGVDLAVAEINQAGGIDGQPVEYRQGSEDPPDTDATVEAHLQEGVDVIVGAASTAVSEEQLDTVVGACTIMFSPSNTSPTFTTAEDDDLYFRTAPSDILQGRVLAELALEAEVTTAAILAREGTYGESLAHFIAEPFEAGGGEAVLEQVYDPDSGDFSADVDAVVQANPKALFMVGLEESSQLVQLLLDQGFTPDQKRIYFVDGNMSNAVGAAFTQPGALAGIQGTFPSAPVGEEFVNRLTAQNPEIADFIYGPEAYDAVIITALAAVAAGTDQADAVAREINGVTRDGQECTSFAQCRDLLVAGTDIDYNGPSGALDFARPGEPTRASIAVPTFGGDNQIDPAATVYRNVTLP